MLDPGRPFSATHSYLDLIHALEEQIRNGVQQVDQARFVFKTSESSYELPRWADAITTVSGVVANTPTMFQPGVDFDLRNNRLLWRLDAAATRPDDATRFTVQYTYRDRPSGLTDFTPGSVISTLVCAVAHELKLLYEQMDEAYRRAFIDTASGVALDNVVALLGVSRKLAKNARGKVTFRRKDTARAVTIRQNTTVATESGLTFATVADAVLGVGVATLDVAIEAQEPGPEGNVEADTIVIMPTPPPGLGSVTITNPEPLKEGQVQESDAQLRERAKFRLERSGNATLNAIKFAVLEQVDGVLGVEVTDHSVDASIPLGEVRVRYSGEADRLAVERVVNQTRAAGVLAQVGAITRILIAGRFYVIPDTSGTDATAVFRASVVDAIQALGIGEPLSLRRLNALAYSIPGLADVAEAQLTHNRADSETTDVTDPFLARPTEQLQPDDSDITVIRLNAFQMTASRDPAATRLSVQLGRVQGEPEVFTPGTFRDVTLDVQLTVRARLLAKPDDAPERVGSLIQSLHFTQADTATLVIPDTAILATPENPVGYRPTVHNPNGVEIVLQAAAFPGLQPTTRTVDFPS